LRNIKNLFKKYRKKKSALFQHLREVGTGRKYEERLPGRARPKITESALERKMYAAKMGTAAKKDAKEKDPRKKAPSEKMSSGKRKQLSKRSSFVVLGIEQTKKKRPVVKRPVIFIFKDARPPMGTGPWNANGKKHPKRGLSSGKKLQHQPEKTW